MNNRPEIKLYLHHSYGVVKLFATINGKVYRCMRIDPNGAAMTITRDGYLEDKLPHGCIDLTAVVDTVASRLGEIMDPLAWTKQQGYDNATQMRLKKNV